MPVNVGIFRFAVLAYLAGGVLAALAEVPAARSSPPRDEPPSVPPATGGLPTPRTISPSAPSAGTSTAPAAAPHAASTVIYETQFAKAADLLPWSSQKTQSKAGHVILGRFRNSTVSLTLRDLPPHAYVRLDVQALAIDSWDGENRSEGPDQFRMALDDGRLLMQATFSADRPGTQSYPDHCAQATYPGGTGASAMDLDWVPHSARDWTTHTSGLYGLKYTFPHTAGALRIDFQGSLHESDPKNDNIENESWGLAGVRVEVLSEPPITLDAKECNTLLKALESSDPTVWLPAFQKLQEVGVPVLDVLEKAAPATDPKPIDELMAKLDDDSYKVREQATGDLIALGPDILPACRAKLAAAPSTEVETRLGEVIRKLEGSTRAPQQGQLRLRRLLEIIGTPRALRLKQALPNPPALPPMNGKGE